MTAIARLPASEAYVSAFRRSESAVTPKLDGLDLPDEVRSKICYGNALRVTPGLPLTGWSWPRTHGCRGSPRSAPDRTAGLPAAAACPPARSAAGRVRLQWRHDREVEILSGQTLSGPYSTITASPRGEVGSNRRGVTSP